jgi:sugar lactone lactonase YvrE
LSASLGGDGRRLRVRRSSQHAHEREASCALATIRRRIYRITAGRGIVYRINPYTDQIVKRIPVGHSDVAWPNGYILDAGGYVWTCEAGNTMSAIDPQTNQVVAWYRLPESCQELAFGNGSIWTALYDKSLVYRIDPRP